MNLDRMVFAPGDKVVRVGHCRSGTPILPYSGKVPQFGVVYCVEDFHEGTTYNYIMIVGFGGWRYFAGQKVGWYAGSFRKVEEIQLCVKAAQQVKEKELQTA